MRSAAFVIILFLFFNAAGYDAGIGRQAFFSGEEYTVTSKLDGRAFGKDNDDLNWQLTARGSDLGSGKIQRENQEFTFKINELRPGMSISAALRFGGHGRQRPVIFSFFSRNPFGEMRQLERVKIGLYPGSSPVAGLLDRYQLPYEKLNSLEDFQEGIVFIGGADFTTQPELSESLQKGLARGLKIIVLPPVKGEIKMPAKLFTKTTPLQRQKIKDLRRGFDVLPLAYGIAPQVVGDMQRLRFSNKGMAAVTLESGRGQLIFSGWSLEDTTNPTGIYLLRYYIDPSDRNNSVENKD